VPKRTQSQNILNLKDYFETEVLKRGGNVPFFVSKMGIISIKWKRIRGSHFQGLPKNTKKDQFVVLDSLQNLLKSSSPIPPRILPKKIS